MTPETTIHSTAIVSPDAKLGQGVQIGPFCVVEAGAAIGDDTRLISHVVVHGGVTCGARNLIHPFATIGGVPQDLKFKGEAAGLVIGDDNVIREGATLNIGTAAGNGETVVGSGCLLMAYAHVAHDCIVGDHTILANSVNLAGHVTLANNVTVGGIAGIHQFCRIGRHAFLAGGSMVVRDVPPFCIAQGDRAMLVGINVVGLKRAGWDRVGIGRVRAAYKGLFQAETTRLMALERVEANPDNEVAAAEMCAFVRESNRGICAARVPLPNTDPYEG